MSRMKLCVLVSCFLVGAAPAAAEMGLYGWGPRLGVSDDPDQIVVGVHQDLGEFAENWRFQPSFDVGFGDDHTIVSAALPVHYRFPSGSGATPYFGGGLLLAWIDRDRPGRGGDSEFEIAPMVAGGVEWRVRKNADALLEIQIPGGDAQDVKLVVGWMFRAP